MTSETQPRRQSTQPDVTTVGPPTQLHGQMGTLRLVFIVLAFNAPLGLVAGIIPLVIAFGPGIGAPLLFLGLGALLVVFAVGYSLMTKTLPGAGAFYTFVTAGLGRVPGLASSFVALVTYAAGIMSILTFSGLSAESLLLTVGGPQISWWIWALAFTCGVAVLGFFRIDFSTRVLGILVTCEVGVVLIYNLVIALKGGANDALSFTSFDPSSLLHGGVAIGLVFAVIAFGGFESTAIFRNEVRDPGKTIPRATYTAISLISVFYCVTSWILIQAYGEDAAVGELMANPTGAFLGTLNQYMGRVAFDIAAVLVVTSGFASVTAMHNVMTRYLFNLGGDGVLPRTLGEAHPRLNSPHRASLLFSVVTLTFVVAAAASSQPADAIYATLAGIAGFALVSLLVMASIAIPFFLMRHRPVGSNAWQHTIAPLIAACALFVLLVVVTINIDLLTGSKSRSFVAIGLVVVSLVGGGALALILRAFRPAVYQRIGAR